MSALFFSALMRSASAPVWWPTTSTSSSKPSGVASVSMISATLLRSPTDWRSRVQSLSMRSNNSSVSGAWCSCGCSTGCGRGSGAGCSGSGCAGACCSCWRPFDAAAAAATAAAAAPPPARAGLGCCGCCACCGCVDWDGAGEAAGWGSSAPPAGCRVSRWAAMISSSRRGEVAPRRLAMRSLTSDANWARCCGENWWASWVRMSARSEGASTSPCPKASGTVRISSRSRMRSSRSRAKRRGSWPDSMTWSMVRYIAPASRSAKASTAASSSVRSVTPSSGRASS